jgi:hypothetical protein
MVTACLISTTMSWEPRATSSLDKLEEESLIENYDSMDGPSEEEAYRQGELLAYS